MRAIPRAASCRATCRPIAPTPITTAWQRANRSGGTRPRWRTSRSGMDVEKLFMAFIFLQELLIEIGPFPGVRKGLSRTPLGLIGWRIQRWQKYLLPLMNVRGEFHLPIGKQGRH